MTEVAAVPCSSTTTFSACLKRSLRQVVPLLIAVMLLTPRISFSEERPPPNGNTAKKFRIGYIEGGPYWDQKETLEAIKTSLQELGWLENVEFPENAHYSPGWDRIPELHENAKDLLSRKDIDLILSGGTSATHALLKINNHRTPIVAMAVSDPVKSGFVRSVTDSGSENFTVRLVPRRYLQMFETFHEVVKFNKLGIVYANTKDGRIYSSVDEALEVADIAGYQVIEHQISTSEDLDECREGIRSLIERGIDAFFIGALNCFDWTENDVEQLFDLLAEKKIPTFAKEGSRQVRSGALMSFSSMEIEGEGSFLAEKIVAILQGAKPGSLAMVDEVYHNISLNLAVAEKIGFDPPVQFMLAADEIFHSITRPGRSP